MKARVGRPSDERKAESGVRSAEVPNVRSCQLRALPPAQFNAGLRFVAEELLPALRRTPGYRGCLILVDGQPGTGLALVLWATEEAADAAAVDHAVIAAHVKLAALGLAIESRKIYEVVAEDVC